jgi:hypothetical protein
MVPLRTKPRFSCLQPASDTTTRATLTHQTQHLHNWLVLANTNYKLLTARPLLPTHSLNCSSPTAASALLHHHHHN